MFERDTTLDERMKWGTCPVCGATHGNYCRSEFGLHVGRKADGSALKTGEGAHLGRLQKAPHRVKLVPVE